MKKCSLAVVAVMVLATPTLAQQASTSAQLPPLVIGETQPTILVPVPIPDFVLKQCGGPDRVTVERGVWVCK